jgi:hypothetical protein
MSLIRDILTENDYSLCLAPGFYCYYAELGVVHALHVSVYCSAILLTLTTRPCIYLCHICVLLQELSALRARFVSGASAGAIVGGFVAAGVEPADILPVVLGLKKEDLLDFGAIGGFVRGQLIQKFLEQ